MVLRSVRALVAASAAAGMLVLAAAAGAGTYSVASLQNVSGASPFGPWGSCNGGPLDSVLYINSEVEPFVAVNPANPANAIGVYQQDRWRNGGARGLVASYTMSGVAGAWARSWAPFSFCSGGTTANGGDFERVSDPWVSFSPNGAAYQISLSFNESNFENAILVTKSVDGGATWGTPVTVARTTGERETSFAFQDKQAITADPTNPNYVYAVWDTLVGPSLKSNASITGAFNATAYRGPTWFARSTDGGVTWEAARPIFDAGQNNQTIGNQIVVLPNGWLVNVFDLISNFKNAHGQRGLNVAVIISKDKGVTWSRPIIVDKLMTVGVVDPDTGHDVRTEDIIPEIAVDPSTGPLGTLYVVWQDSRFSGGAHDDIAFSRSTDGGLHWSAAIKVNQTPVPVAAFTPSVDVAADGTVGVTYYDFRFNTPAPGLNTDYFLVHSHNGGTTWDPETKITPASFDMESAPDARGYFVGDYEGLAHVGSSFLAFFVQSVVWGVPHPAPPAVDTVNRTDAFAALLSP
ncbi:MAG: glycoside hydrolase [Chloroflexota bacterium]|nr:glycoside hydrolase [Chloroflexota bacterium]